MTRNDTSVRNVVVTPRRDDITGVSTPVADVEPALGAGDVRTAERADDNRATFWRSLDELANTDEFRNYVEREFPTQLAVWDDIAGRRNFLKLMAASLALAGVAGCTRQPQEAIVPYVLAPEELIPGKPLYFATTMPGSDAIGLLVESHMGRPTKIEGNALHPASLGTTDLFAQASILGMYDPDRSQTIMRRGVIDTWDRFLTTLTADLQKRKADQGQGLRILTETVTSPTLAAQLESLLEDLPEARWHQYQPLHRDNVRAGAKLAFGKDVDTVYHFDQADVMLSLDADFLLQMPGHVRYARDFIAGRKSENPSRLYVVESTPTNTGAMADHRLPLAPTAIAILAKRIAATAGIEGANPPDEGVRGAPADWLTALIGDLKNAKNALVVCGDGLPAEIQALVHAINQKLGGANVVSYIEPVAARPESHLQSLKELVQDLRDGKVETLVILGGNPVYNSPGELDFAAALAKAKLRIHLSEYFDETSRQCDWHIPAAHYLESWSDAKAFDGTTSIVQPLIAPLYGGKSAHELLAALAGQTSASAYEIVQAHWKKELGEEDFAQRWRRALHDGLITTRSVSEGAPPLAPDSLEVELNLPPEVLAYDPPKARNLTIEFRPDPTIGDGRFANNGWLQECPKPLTKLTWDNAALVSPATAEELSIASGDLLDVSLDDRYVTAPAWIMPGQADGVVSLTFGLGRQHAGRVGTNVGYNAYYLLPADGLGFAFGTLRKADGKHAFALTQNHHSMEGRDIVRVKTLVQLEHPTAPESHEEEHHPTFYNITAADREVQPNAWGMVIDQSACIGCNACVIACQAENNVPIVGKEQVSKGREMHWLRIDRYFHSAPDDLANPETYFQPMMCVQCETAPCEVVCPVGATVHDVEGISNMVYNRCVGTRYCSNNCPYKVRRFNFLHYTDDTTTSLKLMRNPDVTVRSRGVMEKCTYCVQRINVARIAAKNENRPIADGEVVTACQQACPTSAIVFGNLNDPQSKVVAAKKNTLTYGVLADLNTRPRTTHLPRVVNPHPDLPAPGASEAKHEEGPPS
jgi:molybdopterin-containing oxidoreductase family iron-sulfur binding subunit